MGTTERRRDKRFKVNKTSAGYRMVDPKFWAECRAQGHNLLRDISLRGISFKSCDILPKYSVLNLKLKLQDAIKISDIFGRIVRVRKLPSKDYEIGINFSWWSKEEDKINLLRFLERQTT